MKKLTQKRSDIRQEHDKKREQIKPVSDSAPQPLVDEHIAAKLTSKEQEILNEKFADAVNQRDEFYSVRSLDEVKLFLKLGADVNVQDDKGETRLIWVASIGDTNICKLLIDYGADVDIQDKDGETALIGAARNWHSNTVKYLLSVSANPLLKKKDGQTAYDRTVIPEIKQILKKYMERWELIGEKNVLLIQQLVRNCAPEKVYATFVDL